MHRAARLGGDRDADAVLIVEPVAVAHRAGGPVRFRTGREVGGERGGDDGWRGGCGRAGLDVARGGVVPHAGALADLPSLREPLGGILVLVAVGMPCDRILVEDDMAEMLEIKRSAWRLRDLGSGS